jgi:hypothetical protein
MSFHCEVKPLVEQFRDPVYPVVVKVQFDGLEIEGVVIYTRDNIKGKFAYFRELEDLQLPQVFKNTINQMVRESVR